MKTGDYNRVDSGDVLLAQGEVVSQFNNRIVSALPTNRELLHSRAQGRLSVLIDPQQIATLAVTHLNSLVVAINFWRFPEICRIGCLPSVIHSSAPRRLQLFSKEKR